MAVIGLGIFTTSAHAITGWKPGRIIDDSVFTNYNSLSLSSIQSFLNSKVPSCDTYGQKLSEFGGPDLNGDGRVQRWEYGKSRYNQTKFVCLRDYKASDGRTAAKIIYDTAQKYRISPKVLIVLLQKEQSLVTDTWPFNVQYRSATGYGCPDTAACDSRYYGLVNQVSWAATMFRAIMDNSPNWYTPYVLGKNYIQYNPSTSCGGTTVLIENRATQALYNYTPYQPNKAALDAGWGSAPCGAYGNRNFFLYFSNWFGQPNTSATYGYSIVSSKVFRDSGLTSSIGLTSATVEPNSTSYVQIKVKNTGNQTWYRDLLKLGTANPHDRSSAFFTSAWLSPNRPVAMSEETVAAGETATFTFSIKAPLEFKTFTESFGILLEGQRWLPGLVQLDITVASGSAYYLMESSPLTLYYDPAHQIKLDPSSLSFYNGSKVYGSISLKNIGNRTFPSSLTRIATTGPNDRISAFANSEWISANRPAELSQDLTPGQERTIDFSLKAPLSSTGLFNEQFGVVIDTQRWLSTNVGTGHFSISPRPDATLSAGSLLRSGESLVSSNELYRLVLQSDGNLVLYTAANKAIWNSRTYGKGATRLVLQSDGNLVLYTAQYKAVWSTNTSGSHSNHLVMQSDGNLVLYTTTGKYTWYSHTPGKL
ncbi:hypothetical protein KBD87_01370 [Candidatus Saccharibacteria bacterium]|nr:hypothetical protein [Candidatus Saccharibacteria bacterium]